MGLGRTEVTNSARVIIIKQNDFMWGLLVDGITYVTALAPHEIEEQNLTGKNAASDHITRIAKNKDKVVGIFDVNKIVAVLANGKDLFSAVEASHEEP
jgi:chemotaxis signal transduction protein